MSPTHSNLNDTARRRWPQTYLHLYPWFHRARCLYYRARLRHRRTLDFELSGPYARVAQRTWQARLLEVGRIADRAWPLDDSPLELLEDARELGPACTTLDQVRHHGRGAFVRHRTALYFSTSDDSDPNVNGRRYQCSLYFNDGMPAVDWRSVVRRWGWSAAFGAMLVGALGLPRWRGRRHNR